MPLRVVTGRALRRAGRRLRFALHGFGFARGFCLARGAAGAICGGALRGNGATGHSAGRLDVMGSVWLYTSLTR
jgi:hypothetical protein